MMKQRSCSSLKNEDGTAETASTATTTASTSSSGWVEETTTNNTGYSIHRGNNIHRGVTTVSFPATATAATAGVTTGAGGIASVVEAVEISSSDDPEQQQPKIPSPSPSDDIEPLLPHHHHHHHRADASESSLDGDVIHIVDAADPSTPDGGATTTTGEGGPSSSSSPRPPPIFSYLGYQIRTKHIVIAVTLSLILFLIVDTAIHDPEDRLIKPDFQDRLLHWVQRHPTTGIFVVIPFLAVGVVFLIPVAGPMCAGLGYVYTAALGWKVGFPLATAVGMTGTVIGAIACFLLGRYFMRDYARKWIRGNPYLEAVDIASSENGFRIMAMMDLAPIPLGPLSYACGTTSMSLSNFCMAKVFATPRMLLAVYMGACTTSLVRHQSGGGGSSSSGGADEDPEQQQEDEAPNKVLMVAGMLFAGATIAIMTLYIRHELNKIIERQKQEQRAASGGLEGSQSPTPSPQQQQQEGGGGGNVVVADEELAMELTAPACVHRRVANTSDNPLHVS